MAQETPRLTIIFPGLFDLIAEQDHETFCGEFPALARLINRGAIESDNLLNFESAIAHAFAINTGQGAPFNIVELTAEVDEISYNDGLMRADPVHLRADNTQLRLFTGPNFEPTMSEATQLLSELRVLFPELEFHCGRYSGRWYIKFPEPLAFTTAAPSALQQLPIENYLPSGKDARQVHFLMNEIQMALHQSTLNQRRESCGMVPINSIWLWGGGAKIETRRPEPLSVWGDDVTAHALSRRFDIEHFTAPQTSK